MSKLRNVSEQVADHMDAMLKLFKQGAKITVIVRQPDKPDQDFLLTNDTLDDIAAVAMRRKTDPKTQQGQV